MRVVTCLFAVASLLAPDVAAEKSRITTGRHFQIESRCDTSVVKGALAAADGAWGLAVEVFGEPKNTMQSKPMLYLHRTIGEYEAAEQKLTGGRFRKNQAFTSFDTKEAHIAIQPSVSDETLKKIGLTLLTRRTFAHEATHVVSYYTIPSYRELPDWFSEGAATYVEQRVMEKQGFAKDRMQDPFYSTAATRAQRLVNENRLPKVSQILVGDLTGLSHYERYAVWRFLFEFLMSKPRRAVFERVFPEVRKLKGEVGDGVRVTEIAKRVLGKRRLNGMDDDFADFVKGLTPIWNQVYRTMDVRKEGYWVHHAFPDSNAIAWRTEPVGRSRYSLSGSIEFLPVIGSRSDSRQMNILLGKNDSGFISVALVTGNGVLVFDYSSPRNHWNQLAHAGTELLNQEGPIPFRVEVDEDRLTVEIDGQEVVEVGLRGRDMTGPYGVGAQAGYGGIWRKVQLKKRR